MELSCNLFIDEKFWLKTNLLLKIVEVVDRLVQAPVNRIKKALPVHKTKDVNFIINYACQWVWQARTCEKTTWEALKLIEKLIES